MDERLLHKIPPIKREAAICLARGPMAGRWNGEWASDHTRRRFNSHTIGWLVSVGWAAFNRDKTQVSATAVGISFAAGLEEWP